MAIDWAPWAAIAAALYGGAWLAERTAAVGDFLDRAPTDADPVVAAIVRGGRAFSAVDAHRAPYELLRLRRVIGPVWSTIDAVVLPTTPTTFTPAEIAAEPVARNSMLGHFTNFFANLLDLCAIAVPGPDRTDGLPAGVTLFAPA